MGLTKSDYDVSLAKTIHGEFKRKPGSGRIASEFSLYHLSRLIRLRRPKVVLEIGSGIGTVSQLVLAHPERVQTLFSIEQEPFCRAAINENLTRSRVAEMGSAPLSKRTSSKYQIRPDHI